MESGILPLLRHACVPVMLTIKRLAGVTPEMNLGECTSCRSPLSANKAAHSGFETPEVQNRGISDPIKGHMSTKEFKKPYVDH